VSHATTSPRLQINARLVKERDRARARELRRLLVYGAAIVVPLLVYVWQRVEFLSLSYEVEGLKKERQQLQEQNKQLTLERSFLLSPDRIERLARKELGLVDPQPSDVRRVAVIDGKINEVGTRVQASAAGSDAPAPVPKPAPRRAAAAGRPAQHRRRAPAPPKNGNTTTDQPAVEAGVGMLPPVAPPPPNDEKDQAP